MPSAPTTPISASRRISAISLPPPSPSAFDFLSNIVSFVSFVGILWGLSGTITLFGMTIPGYMVFIALIYAVIGTGLTHLVGRPLIGLRFQQQRVEADFRYALVRLRENMEGVALYGGEHRGKG